MARKKSEMWSAVALILGAIIFSVVAGEVFARIIDDHGAFSWAKYFGTHPTKPIDNYIAKIESGRQSVGELWKQMPPALERRGVKAEDQLRLKEFGDKNIDTEFSGQVMPSELFKVWNSKLVDEACTHDVLKHLTKWPFDTFESPSGDVRPRYRYRPDTTLPTGLVTNQIGWRGKSVEPRSRDTVRIVFVGASTIAEASVIPWSAPELIEGWLNTWAKDRGLRVRFQVLNAGRDAATTPEVAAIVRDEVVPLRPDLVIFYEGALQFSWSSVVKDADKLWALPRPQYLANAGWVADLAQQSSLFAHILAALNGAGLRLGNVKEAPKPKYEIDWPKGLDESDPDVSRKDLPLNLTQIMGDLDQVRTELAKVGSDFVLSSFAWLVYDGLTVDPVKGRYIWEVNNNGYWPWTYRDIRRGVDFENRVYRKFAKEHGLAFLDVAPLIPEEPMLFADGVHMTESGVRVKAWAFFRELLPLIEQHLASGAWPRNIAEEKLPAFDVKRRSVSCSK